MFDCYPAWRKVLKDLITYFRDVQKTYEARSKSLLAVSNVINNISTPPVLLTEGGIGDALYTLRDYHKKSITEASKARNIEDDILAQLTGLRSDLQQKIKEIKNLSGDFKNSVDKEMEGTRRAVRDLHDALENVKSDSGGASGKGDPYVVKLGVDRQVERQIDEENYLHRVCSKGYFKRKSQPHQLTKNRHSSIWKILVENWSQSLLAKSKKHTVHILVSSNVRQMTPTKQWRKYELVRLLWRKTTNGMLSSLRMNIS